MTAPQPNTAHVALIPTCSCNDGGREIDDMPERVQLRRVPNRLLTLAREKGPVGR